MCIEGMLLIVTLYAQEVLGYSTIQFGLMTAVMTVMSVIGAYSAQATVNEIELAARGRCRDALDRGGVPAADPCMANGAISVTSSSGS